MQSQSPPDTGTIPALLSAHKAEASLPCHSCSQKHSSHPLLFLPVLTLHPFPKTNYILSWSNRSKGRVQQDGLFLSFIKVPGLGWLQIAERCLLPTSEQMNPPEPCVPLSAPPALPGSGVIGEGCVGVGLGAAGLCQP